jgi:nicotinamidase-related amidase
MSLSAQLTRRAPAVKTYQALVIFGMQEDFLLPHGELPVDTSSGFVDRIIDLVPKFRDRAGIIIWVKSETDTEAAADAYIGAGRTAKRFFATLDKDLERHCHADERGVRYMTSDFAPQIKPAVQLSTDIVVEKRHASAFTSPAFVTALHQNLIGDVYLCGCVNEISIYAFARGAASRGMRINVLQDCLGYRNRSRNDIALRRMVSAMDATRITSVEMHRDFDRPLKPTASPDDLADMMTGIMTMAASASEPSREEAETEAGAEAGAEDRVGAETETAIEVDVEFGAETETEVPVQVKVGAEPEIKVDVGTETGTVTRSGAEVEAGAEAGAGASTTSTPAATIAVPTQVLSKKPSNAKIYTRKQQQLI